MSPTLNEMYKSTKEKAEYLQKIVKLKMAIKSAEEELSSLFYELGCEFYNECSVKSGSGERRATEDILMLIEKKRSDIKELRREYNTLRRRVDCPSCGKTTSSGYGFCPYCGAALSADAKNAPENKDAK